MRGFRRLKTGFFGAVFRGIFDADQAEIALETPTREHYRGQLMETRGENDPTI